VNWNRLGACSSNRLAFIDLRCRMVQTGVISLILFYKAETKMQASSIPKRLRHIRTV
jgi:hypothetical protein